VAAGSFIQTFTFTNVSRRVCSLTGWPRIGLPSRRVRQGAPPTPAYRTVVLRPRGAASFDVYGADWDHVRDRACPRTSTLRVAPPGVRSRLAVTVRMPNCGRFDVAPVIAGKTDREAWSVVWRP
jgi:hypothetical protein